MSQTAPQDVFMEEVRRLRAAYEKQRDSTNLVPPTGRPVLDNDIDIVDGIVYHTYWYERTSNTAADSQGEECQVVRLADIPGTLSGDILRLERNLPPLDPGGDYNIIGDDIHRLVNPPPLPCFEDDSEDISAALASLPEIEVDPDAHFIKKGKYATEIQNLLACQGGSCPGVPKSAHVIRLLGKSLYGELVFEKFTPRYVLAAVHPLSKYKAWILQLIDGLRCLHSLEIIHRDLRIDNLVFSRDNSRLLICDLESRWGNRLAPEISRRPVLDAGWTKKSDIYDLGMTIKGMIYGNTPITNLVEWHAPPPLDDIVASCLRISPEDRPSLDEVYDMVENIKIH
ncbi:kinase-like domain-containing protein [Apiosordaria backusii]|uniref:EKC/KEOPS complex subunit BUD32 n=1 Tax=Apiosordaria backusii TaxID=314023 RepID=A0AA40K142_9PEZI|nr:kinase-like domain-containing protein [Apiosordaria backusii]